MEWGTVIILAVGLILGFGIGSAVAAIRGAAAREKAAKAAEREQG